MDMEGLSVICAGIGLADEDEIGNRVGYSTGEYCLDNLKDLLRFLRRDDPQTREVFKQVCKWNIVSKDLIPIFEYCQDDRNLVLNAVKVLVFLTMPIEPSSNDIPQQIEYLWGLKSAITCSDTVAVIVSLLEGPLENLECEAFTEDDWKLVQLVLTFFRNILAIQDIPPHQKAGGSASEFMSLRDKFMELLFNENVMDIIIVIAQHVGGSRGHFRHDNLLLLETFHYIFIGQDPELIAKVHQKGSKGGDNKDSLDSLKSLMAKEEEKRKLSRLQNAIRHSQFSGTFARPTMDGSKAVFKGNPNRASHNTILKPHKGHKGVNKRIVWDIGGLPSTKDNVLELLHDFVNQFLSGSYNVLMQSIRKDIEKEHHAIQNSDIIIFFRVAQFVTSFQYHKILSSKPTKETDTSEASADEFTDSTLFKGNICGPIASSMDDSMFQLVISKWRYAFDGLKETKEYNFLSAAGSLMKNMIRMLDLVLKLLPEDSKEPQTARILLYKLFYDQTDQGVTQFLLNLIKAFDTHKQPKSDLADLVEMICVLVRLMEKLQARGTLRVSKKSRRGRKKEVVKSEKEAESEGKKEVPNGEKQAESEGKKEVLNGEKEAESEGKKEVPNGEKEAESEGKKKVLKGEKEAENEVSGSHATILDDICISNSEHIEDFCMLQKENPTNTTSDGNEDMTIPAQIDEPEKPAPGSGDLGVNLPQKDKRKSDHADDYLNCSSGDSGDEQPAATDEVDFRVSTFISAFANCSIIQKLCWLLNFYKSNSNRTNHYIICMLRTITDDLELAPMLYQLSLLTTFYDILAEQKSCPCKDYENIVDFLKSLVRKMFKRMKNQPLLFVEILFWKTRRECHYINAEYMLQELGNVKKRTGNWENVSEIGEIGSSQAKGWTRRSLADALGEDEADVVISHDLGYQNESQEDIPSGLNSETDRWISSMQGEFDKVPKRKRRLVLSNEWDKKIKDLYDKFKDDQNCSRLIAESLDPDGKVSVAQVSNKLKQLGFQLAPKKRVHSTAESRSAGPDQPGEEQVTMESKSVLHNSDDLEGSLLSQPLNKRKRVHAFSRDQEAMIKVLYEQFKDHKRCSYMIANALDDGNTFTAAQITRKLKQLGLHTPKQKKSEAHMNLRDEEPNDTAVDEVHDSDNETLLSFRKRKKIKDDGGLFDKEPQQKNIEGKMPDDSDEETISSVLKKSRKLHPESEDKRLGTTLAKGINEDSRNSIAEDVTESDGDNRSSEEAAAGTDKDITFNQVNPDKDPSETELTINNVDDLPDQLMDDDDMADLEDDLAPDESTRSVVSRRKLRMVIDADDDDD
ncbi:hypothetical protein Q3G72_018520 [Acer saccharum]|nr:hypothetical protein Q3G72_018520 [Acer saccharum]